MLEGSVMGGWPFDLPSKAGPFCRRKCVLLVIMPWQLSWTGTILGKLGLSGIWQWSWHREAPSSPGNPGRLPWKGDIGPKIWGYVGVNQLLGLPLYVVRAWWPLLNGWHTGVDWSFDDLTVWLPCWGCHHCLEEHFLGFFWWYFNGNVGHLEESVNNFPSAFPCVILVREWGNLLTSDYNPHLSFLKHHWICFLLIFLKIVVKYITSNSPLQPFLCLHFSGAEYVHIVVQPSPLPISRTLPSP